MVQAVPEGFNTVSPHLVVSPCAEAIEFYCKAFGAEKLCEMPGPGGVLMHAEIRIGNSQVMLCDEMPGMTSKGPKGLGGSPVTIHLYVEDVDALMKQAEAAGAKVTMPAMDMFWGDRYGKVTDPYGHQWSIATHVEDVSPEEMAGRANAMFAGGEGGQEAAG
jgi:uncharacterized glyoxalase superfamily protein PhnB